MIDPQRIRIRRALDRDVSPLTAFAFRVFYETFAHNNDPAALAAYMAEAYSEDATAATLCDPRLEYHLLHVDGALAAYALLEPRATFACLSLRHPLRITRFYVDRAWQGLGVAHRLMEHCLTTARAHGADGVWLGVWEHNHRARAFYQKYGFVEVGTMPFRFGPEMQEDLVVELRFPGNEAAADARRSTCDGGPAEGG